MPSNTVLVTGAAGFIGSHLVELLLSEGHEVVGFDNFDSFYDPSIKRRNVAKALKSKRYRLIEGDLRSDGDVDHLFRVARYGTVIHLAARAGVRPSLQEPVLYDDVNVRGTTRLLEALRRQGGAPFVFGSSSSVYGATSLPPFREDDMCDRPSSPYASTKRSGEISCYAFHHLYGFPMTCLRFFTVYGPRQRPEMAIHKFTRLIDRGQPVTLFGDGNSRRDYTFVSDIVEGISAAARRDKGFAIFNLGTSDTTSLAELVGLIEARLGKAAVLDRRPEEPGDVPLTYADTSRAAAELGFAARTSLPEGLDEFVEWYRSDQKSSPAPSIIDLRSRGARVAVVGSGYVGTVVAAGLSSVGHQVVGVESDRSKVETLSAGKAPFYEGGLDDLLREGIEAGHLRFTANLGDAAAQSDAIFICVGTPTRPDGRGADLSALDAVASEIAPHLDAHKDLIIKSTVPIGTGRWLSARIEDLTGVGINGRPRMFSVVNNPEFLREGSAVSDYLSAERVVLGSDDPEAIERVAAIYRPITDAPGRRPIPVVKTSPAAAEMAKYASNSFLAARVSFINEIANICDYLGADVTDVSAIMGLDSRIGPQYLDAGVGWGGSCFGKDLRALVSTASEYGYDPVILNSVIGVNYYQRERVTRLLTTALGGLRGRRLAVLGLAFKSGTDDLRDAPALDVAASLVELGATVRAYDPMVKSLPMRDNVHLTDSPYEAAERAEAVVVMTEWPEIVDLDLDRLASCMSGRLLLDGRNIYSPAKVVSAGLVYQGIGRGSRPDAAVVKV